MTDQKLSERIKHNLEIGYYAYNSQLLNEVEALESKLRIALKFIRDEDWSDYLEAIEHV
jgi:hypothetical protein